MFVALPVVSRYVVASRQGTVCLGGTYFESTVDDSRYVEFYTPIRWVYVDEVVPPPPFEDILEA